MLITKPDFQVDYAPVDGYDTKLAIYYRYISKKLFKEGRLVDIKYTMWASDEKLTGKDPYTDAETKLVWLVKDMTYTDAKDTLFQEIIAYREKNIVN